ncbi:MAG: DUF86 domain-containing protein [Saprospiraceae bacterium]|uniref:DUF86 domain-containing protein n=1 Tax=Candidatus Opimibacter skivensis TaxID=2982028 RepID=A0A9D7XSI4_9BACT|nr:DUF86 domain-containing protein [Candidatus Opimibacter skivensis]
MKPDIPTTKERLNHAISAIEKIQSFAKEYSLKKFIADEKTKSACLYQFAIISEATSHVDHDILEKYEYPWFKIRAFRNFILHEYHGIEMRIVWETIQDILPDLKTLLEKILVNEFRSNPL